MDKLDSNITLVDTQKERFEWLSELPEDLFADANDSNEEAFVMGDINSNEIDFDDIISYDMHNENNQKIGNCVVSIHKNKTSPRGGDQVYPDSWFADEFSEQLKPYMEIVGFGTVGGDTEGRGNGFGREALKAIYNFSLENECAGRMETHATFGAGGFYEACGFKHLNNKNRTAYVEEGYHSNDGIKYFDPNDNASMSKLTKVKNQSQSNFENIDFGFDGEEGFSLEESIESKSPKLKFNLNSGEFEYEDPEMQAKAEQRRASKRIEGILEKKQSIVKQGLEEIGLGGQMGKTGNSKTGEVSETHKEVADSQIEDLKPIIKEYLNEKTLSK